MTPFRFLDQGGHEVPITVKQDGGPPGWVTPGRRTRFKLRHYGVALRIERIAIGPNPKDWLINDLRIGGKSQFPLHSGNAHHSIHGEDTPEQDGIDADVLCATGPNIRADSDRFDTAQTAMAIIFDVVYRGPHPEGQPFTCTIHCMAE